MEAPETYEGFSRGDRVRVIHDGDGMGYWEGCTGDIEISIVGAPEHGNERVSLSLVNVADEYGNHGGVDDGLEVNPHSITLDDE